MPVGGVVRVEKIEYPPEQTGPESVWIFRINFSKTPGSTRDVPLPQGLLDLGFLEHRVLGRDPEDPLFPELIPQGNAKARGAAFTGASANTAARSVSPTTRWTFTRSRDARDRPREYSRLQRGLGGRDHRARIQIRRSVRTLYTKGVLLGHLKDTLDRVRFRGAGRLPGSSASRACRFPERRARSRIL